jgi:hypothetical protein
MSIADQEDTYSISHPIVLLMTFLSICVCSYEELLDCAATMR